MKVSEEALQRFEGFAVAVDEDVRWRGEEVCGGCDVREGRVGELNWLAERAEVVVKD